MTSPRWPYCPADPPRRWMQDIFFAAELSATSRTVPIWIMATLLLRPLQNLADSPALGLRQRTGRDDLDHVADLATVVLVVSVELGRPLHVPVIEPVGGRVLDRHDDGLVHLLGDHPADLHLPPAARRGSLLGRLFGGVRCFFRHFVYRSLTH